MKKRIQNFEFWLSEGHDTRLLVVFIPMICFGIFIYSVFHNFQTNKNNQKKYNPSFVITYNDTKCKVKNLKTTVSDFEIKNGYVYFEHNRLMKIKECDIIDICEKD